MHPILLDLGPISLPTYGFLMAVAFLIALRWMIRLGRQEGIDAEQITGLWIWILVGGILGAKIFLWAVEWRTYVADPAALLRTWRSAGVYYGGLAVALAATVVYTRREGLPLGAVADLCTPPLALGQSIGRIGCTAAGCCWGRPADVPWALTFTDPRARELTGVPLGVPLHPSQIYLSLNALLLAIVLLALLRLRRRRGWPPGSVFLSYVLLYSGTRIFLETFRGDPRGVVGPLSTSQALGIVGVAASLVGLAILWRRRTREAG